MLESKTYTGQLFLIDDAGVHFTGEQEVYSAESHEDAVDQAYYYHGLSGTATRGPSGFTVMFSIDGDRFGVSFTKRSDEEKRQHREDVSRFVKMAKSC